ncbi:MAG: YhcH/YjgK/YiaL family protein [Bacteroidetes bacterium]|nr:YhcH/YjgK/YiaL family protein [Bacteroidota bacterium]MBS1929987.1 YhcH/YjgK/YiaL family protein [Bacteroidota bacterium]
MIIDNLTAAEKYYSLHPIFVRAFERLKSIDLQNIKEGRYELDGDRLYFILTNNEGKGKEESISRFECHNEYIDIQLCLKGRETIGWKSRKTCHMNKISEVQGDNVFYNEHPDFYFQLTDNQFAIFFPDDVHAPMIGESKIKKVVMKIKI